MTGPETIVAIAQVWLITGAVVAAIFLTVGMDRIDEDAQGAYVFRPLLVPGVLLIWPLVLWRWWTLETKRDDWTRRYTPPRRSHAVVAILMLFVVTATLVTGFAIRQTWPADVAPVQIAPAEASQ